MRGCGPNRYQPEVSCISVLPVAFMLGAAAADDVQRDDEHAEDGADGDGDVELVEVAVDVPFEVRVIQIRCSLLDSGHDTP
uniref:Putative secreted protein n=1 Tax=Anopheles marajoara TaxID=58244 RepID=A0A2M4CBJ9_9DIPT